MDGEASRSTLKGTKWGGAGKSDELGREDSKSGTVSGVVGDGREEASEEKVEIELVEYGMNGGHENHDECVLRVRLA